MSIIKCAKNCKRQKDGYCMLEKMSTVTNVSGGCPHFLAKDSGDSPLKTADGHKLDINY